jgi:hypothetical protein
MISTIQKKHMMYNHKKIRKNWAFFAVFTLSVLGFRLQAQQEQALNFVDSVWQAGLTNPAIGNSKKFNIALSSLYVNLNSLDFSIDDFVKEEGGQRVLRLDSSLLSSIAPLNRFDGNFSFQTLAFGFPITPKLRINLHHIAHVGGKVDFTGDLLTLFSRGNSPFLGKTGDFNLGSKISLHNEFGIGASYKLPIVTVGLRVKLLFGVAGLFTERDQVKVSFNADNYNLNFENDLLVKTFAFEKLEGLKLSSDLLTNNLFSDNRGMAFDLGVSGRIGKFSFSASALDLGGSINWKGDGKSYESKGKYLYTGRNVERFFNIDSLSASSWQDTLKRVIGFKETTTATFTQKLPTRVYLNGAYQLHRMLRLGMLVYLEKLDDRNRSGFSLDATTSLLKFLNLGLTFSSRNGDFNNLGAHAALKLGPVQIYAVTDNVATVFNPYGSKTANGRVGLNLLF